MGADESPGEHHELLARIRSGDESAFAALLREYAGPLERYVSRHLPADVSGQFDLQDVLQEIYLEAFQRIDQFVEIDSSSIQRWLMTIARHQIVDLMRHHRALKRGGGARATGNDLTNSREVIPMLQELAIYERTPSQSALSHEQHLLVQTALERIRPLYREVLHLRYLAALPIEEIAQRLNRGSQAVQMLCYRALKELRRELDRNETLSGE